ncbi:hypothetical protein IPC444_13565 [Pseudomonas aeruginosa]|uniref:hypothetical protein n=1 Tax=Pseudomonas aeruginosa TaxID=287 RepID=UPI000F88EFB6|nr:hypothetical protein [Pseudomonas aeruginosa]RUI04828.1 hypothetical protein IPC444_13565 [Pseudomonas aeruginosa]
MLQGSDRAKVVHELADFSMHSHLALKEKTAEEISFQLKRATEILSITARALTELAAEMTASGNILEAQKVLRASNKLSIVQMDLEDTGVSLASETKDTCPTDKQTSTP